MRIRYAAIDLLDDARDVRERDATAAAQLCAQAFDPIISYYFLAQGRWIPRRKELLSTVDALDHGIGGLAREAITGDCEQRVAASQVLAMRCLGTSGFFDWESARDPC